ncbi:glycosyltransferase [Synechococcus sp. BIOS-E4-1]|uniref:glycosyltransferase n=1 Tax=Synechococcus sp. BIOS-E4-1 TaxID=1400864 RepID=UPI001647207F|nr:glycosyltransferase [Synechococcus sp. BIOS-E4-1]
MYKTNGLRIAFLSNMNNNHFALARYLRDEGFDCELLLFTDEQDHFHPKCDTFTLEFMTWIKRISWGSERQLLTINPKVIQADLDKYDVFIGCGLAPAFLCKAGLLLDIMIPYGNDIWSETMYRFALPHYIAKSISSTYFQRKGLSQSKIVNCALGAGIYGSRIRKLCSNSLFWKFDIPMVYHRQYADPVVNGGSHWISEFEAVRNNADLMVVAHGRHVWGNASDPNVKGNNLLIKAWHLFCQRNPSIKAKLVFIEYGQNVTESKQYVTDLGLNASVKWFPQMFRKDIMPALLMADIVAAEFVHSWIGGGVIFEALVAGKPLLMHSIEHEKSTTMDNLYPIYNAKTPVQIAARLQEYVENKERGKEIGLQGQYWYKKYVVDKALTRYSQYFEERAAELGKVPR